jgi:hypothetical protein
MCQPDKIAVIALWIYHSQVKPSSLEWECIPDPASLCRITLQNLRTLPPQNSASQETTGVKNNGTTALH